MSVTFELVLLLIRSAKSRFLLNRSVTLNVIAIISGVAFLVFALAIYDSYYRTVERIIFSLTPHVMLRPPLEFAQDDDVKQGEAANCVKVCKAPFTVHYRDGGKAARATGRFPPEKVAAIQSWLGKDAPAGLSASRVLFEEAKLEIRLDTYSSNGLRPMQLLGLEVIQGKTPSPRVDLAFQDQRTAERFYSGAGILISDALATEIAKVTGKEIVPGQSVISMGLPGSMHNLPIAGIHRLGIHAISRNLVIAPFAMAAKLRDSPADAGPSYIGLTLSDPAGAREIATSARDALRGDEVAAIAWQQVTDLFKQLELYRAIIYVTLSLSLLVTAINTLVNINILIMERARQIGIMRAMGLTPGKLRMVFISMGIVQSVIGTVIGYALGLLIGYALSDHINRLVQDFVPISNASISPDPMVLGAILAFVTLISVSASLIAGRRALGNDIVEGLRSA